MPARTQNQATTARRPAGRGALPLSLKFGGSKADKTAVRTNYCRWRAVTVQNHTAMLKHSRPLAWGRLMQAVRVDPSLQIKTIVNLQKPNPGDVSSKSWRRGKLAELLKKHQEQQCGPDSNFNESLCVKFRWSLEHMREIYNHWRNGTNAQFIAAYEKIDKTYVD